jgi:hypothetical protein
MLYSIIALVYDGASRHLPPVRFLDRGPYELNGEALVVWACAGPADEIAIAIAVAPAIARIPCFIAITPGRADRQLKTSLHQTGCFPARGARKSWRDAKQSRKESAKRQTKSRATKKARAAAESVTCHGLSPKAAQGQAGEERYKPAPLELAERPRPGRNNLRTLPPRPLPADRGRPHGGASDRRGCRPRQNR